MVKIGDKVQIINNPKNTFWETGFVMDIAGDEVLINYGSLEHPVYGMGIWKHVSLVKVIE